MVKQALMGLPPMATDPIDPDKAAELVKLMGDFPGMELIRDNAAEIAAAVVSVGLGQLDPERQAFAATMAGIDERDRGDLAWRVCPECRRVSRRIGRSLGGDRVNVECGNPDCRALWKDVPDPRPPGSKRTRNRRDKRAGKARHRPRG